MSARLKRHLLLLVALLFLPGGSVLAQEDAAAAASYQLGTGDRIRVTVFEEPDLSIEAAIDATGAISYPLLGVVEVAGLTARGLETAIADGLRGRFLINPRVNVAITEYRPFFVRGEVGRPGGYPFRPGLTVEKAVSLAGGFTSRASKSAFFIVAENSDEKQRAKLSTPISPGDILHIEQSFF